MLHRSSTRSRSILVSCSSFGVQAASRRPSIASLARGMNAIRSHFSMRLARTLKSVPCQSMTPTPSRPFCSAIIFGPGSRISLSFAAWKRCVNRCAARHLARAPLTYHSSRARTLIDEEIRNEVVRARHHRIALEIRFAMFPEQSIIDEEIAARGTGIARENQPRRIGENLGLAGFLQVNTRNQ